MESCRDTHAILSMATDMKFSVEESRFAQVPHDLTDAPSVEDMPMILNYITARLRELTTTKTKKMQKRSAPAPKTETCVKRLREEDGDTQPVQIDDPVSMHASARVALAWGTHKTTDPVVCAVPKRMIHTMQGSNQQCAYCKTVIHGGSEYVASACAQTTSHAAHLLCYAFMKHKLPTLSCPGELMSACAHETLTASEAELETINKAAMHKLSKSLEMKRALVAKGCAPNANKSRFNATEKMTRRFGELLERMETMQMPPTAEFVPQSRNVLSTAEENCSCVVCGNAVRIHDSLVTCTRHKVHKACWVYFRVIRERVGADKSVDEQKRVLQDELKVRYAHVTDTKEREKVMILALNETTIFSACTECPAHLLAHPDCAHAHACE